MSECIVSDSSFYICFLSDLKKRKWLYKFLNYYSFHLGEKILGELPDCVRKDEGFIVKVSIDEYDYYELIKPFFGREKKHRDDGEYEAIGIAYHLNRKNSLKCLIIDESKARNFVNRHFPKLREKLVGTIGFIRNCYLEESIDIVCALDILTSIKDAVEKGEKERPCSMNEKNYRKILMPAIKGIRRCFDGK